MPRNKFQVIMILFVGLAVFACDKISGPGPNEILNSYLDASLKGRYEEAYSYVSAEDKSIKDLQSYLKENSKQDNPFAQAIVSKVSFKILKLEKADKTASADVVNREAAQHGLGNRMDHPEPYLCNLNGRESLDTFVTN